MKTIEQRRLEFLEDTVAYYSEDTSRRAVSDYATCKYRTEDGRKCAIGRHIPDDRYRPSMEDISVRYATVHNLLPDSIQELGITFLEAVQQLHDQSAYWNSDGLTEAGSEYVDKIKLTYCK